MGMFATTKLRYGRNFLNGRADERYAPAALRTEARQKKMKSGSTGPERGFKSHIHEQQRVIQNGVPDRVEVHDHLKRMPEIVNEFHTMVLLLLSDVFGENLRRPAPANGLQVETAKATFLLGFTAYNS